MDTQFNIGGSIKSLLKAQINIGGTIKDVSKIQANIGGGIKDLWSGNEFDDYVKSMLHFNVSGTSTTFTDETGRIWTAHGNAQLNAAQKKFGTASAYFDGTGDYIDTPASEDFNVGSGDFTIDFWVKRNTLNTIQNVFGQYDTSAGTSNTSIAVIFINSNMLQVSIFSSSSSITIASSAITDSNWHHVAIVRYGNTLALYIDGDTVASTGATGFVANSSTVNFAVGRIGDYNAQYFNGWIDEFRFSKGIARWTSNFTPPKREYDIYAPVPLTMSLLHFNGSDASATFTDEAGRTWTAHGNARLDTAQKKFGTASGFFDGAGDYIDTPASEDLNVWSGDFTIDFWVKRNSIDTFVALFGQCDSSGSAASTSIRAFIYITDNKPYFTIGHSGGTVQLVSTTAIADTNWHHFALVRSGNTLYFFIDGSAAGTLDMTGIIINNSSNKFSIGAQGESTGTYFNGWIDEFRFSKGVARWTSNFTPPTSEYALD